VRALPHDSDGGLATMTRRTQVVSSEPRRSTETRLWCMPVLPVEQDSRGPALLVQEWGTGGCAGSGRRSGAAAVGGPGEESGVTADSGHTDSDDPSNSALGAAAACFPTGDVTYAATKGGPEHNGVFGGDRPKSGPSFYHGSTIRVGADESLHRSRRMQAAPSFSIAEPAGQDRPHSPGMIGVDPSPDLCQNSRAATADLINESFQDGSAPPGGIVGVVFADAIPGSDTVRGARREAARGAGSSCGMRSRSWARCGLRWRRYAPG
jgi:hypothetical protein